MAGETVQYKRTVKGSVGAGMGALFNGSGRQFFILQHKDSSRYHQAGESQKIIIDQIELGRAKECQIRYDDETWPIVSRRHAAIEKDATGWKIVPLSQTNSTLVNGKVVNTAWYLQNGDEIQLSIGGPRLGFIVPAGNQSLVSSIKLTERLNLFREQALRPYKTAIGILCGALVVACCVGGYVGYSQHQQILIQQDEINKGKENTAKLKMQIDTTTQRMKELEDENRKLIDDYNRTMANFNVITGNISEPALVNALKSVYFIRTASVEVLLPNGNVLSLSRDDAEMLYWSGTGFLLDDGRFVTARHVVDGYKYINSLEEIDLIYVNALENLGAKVVMTFEAFSPEHSFTFTNHDCIIDRRTDERGQIPVDCNKDGSNDTITLARLDNSDWAYVRTSFKGTLKVNNDVNKTIKRNRELVVLGYPRGYVTNDVKALDGSCKVASDGLHDGLIVVTDRNFEQGNSGGPVLVVRPDRSAEVVGIVSSGYGDTVGHIVSITNLK